MTMVKIIIKTLYNIALCQYTTKNLNKIIIEITNHQRLKEVLSNRQTIPLKTNVLRDRLRDRDKTYICCNRGCVESKRERLDAHTLLYKVSAGDKDLS